MITLNNLTQSGITQAVGQRISLAHGGGGQLTDELLASCVLPRLANPR